MAFTKQPKLIYSVKTKHKPNFIFIFLSFLQNIYKNQNSESSKIQKPKRNWSNKKYPEEIDQTKKYPEEIDQTKNTQKNKQI